LWLSLFGYVKCQQNLAILLIFIGTSCGNPTKSQAEEVEMVKVSELEPGPIRHEQLANEQLARIQKIHETFLEVSGVLLEETIAIFSAGRIRFGKSQNECIFGRRSQRDNELLSE